MRGRKRCCWAALPNVMITGPTIRNPKGKSRGAPQAAHSSSKMNSRTGSQPVPPCSLGQVGAPQPCPARMRCQPMLSSRVSSRPFRILWRVSAGRLARTNARTSCRKDSSSGVKLRSMSIQQIRLFTDDLFVERLELEEAGVVRAHLRAREERGLAIDLDRLARGVRQKLRLAASLQRDEPESGLFHRVPDGDQAVVAEDDGLLLADGRGDAAALRELEHDAREIVEERVVLEESAGVLRQRIEQPPQARERLAVHRVRVGGGDRVGAGGVDLRMDREGRGIDRAVPFHHLALMIDEDQVGGADMPEVHSEGIDPEMVEALRIARGDVTSDPLVESIAGEEAEGRCQALFAVE